MLRALRLEAHELCTLSNVPRQRDRAREERTEREEGEEDSTRRAATGNTKRKEKPLTHTLTVTKAQEDPSHHFCCI